jgi:hypothetical protein
VAEQPKSLILMEGFASIHGLFVPDELSQEAVLVEFEPGLEIIRLDAETQRLMYQTETIRRVGGLRWNEHYFAVRVRFEAAAEGEARLTAQQRANALLKSVLDCLRLFQAGQLYYGGIIHRSVARTGPVDIFSCGWPDTRVALYPLQTRENIDALAKLWSMLRDRGVRDRQFVTLAVRWFSLGAESTRITDKVIFLMTAAEALFQAGPLSNKSEQIANAAVKLGLNPVQHEDVHNHLKDSYELRNDILHKGHLTSWRSASGQRLSPSELQDFVEITTAHMRTAIRAVIEGIIRRLS